MGGDLFVIVKGIAYSGQCLFILKQEMRQHSIRLFAYLEPVNMVQEVLMHQRACVLGDGSHIPPFFGQETVVLGIDVQFFIVGKIHRVCRFCEAADFFFRNADFQNSMDMLRQIFTTFRPQLFPQLIEGYWRVFALMLLGFLLHFTPDSWENAACRGVIRLPFLGKALLMVALIYLVIQMKSSEIQPFIYFQF